MKHLKLTLATLALLLSACAPAAIAQTPIANTQAAIIQTPPAEASQVSTTVENTALNSVTETNVASDKVASAPVALAAVTSQQVPKYENLDSPVDLLSSYYNAINRKEYQRAYGYWKQAPISYQSFANGFADTSSVQLIVQPPTRIEGAAGSVYAEIATLLIAQHTDGSTHTYAGCITTRKINLQPPDVPEVDVWHLNQATLEEVPNNASIPNLLAQACPS